MYCVLSSSVLLTSNGLGHDTGHDILADSSTRMSSVLHSGLQSSSRMSNAMHSSNGMHPSNRMSSSLQSSSGLMPGAIPDMPGLDPLNMPNRLHAHQPHQRPHLDTHQTEDESGYHLDDNQRMFTRGHRQQPMNTQLHPGDSSVYVTDSERMVEQIAAQILREKQQNDRKAVDQSKHSQRSTHSHKRRKR